MASQPDISALLNLWWGGGLEGYCGALIPATNASNIITGGNPTYQLCDFLAVYPKFGTYAQAIIAATIQNGGSGYSVGDSITPNQPDSNGGNLLVVTATSVGGVITGLDSIPSGGVGTGYSVANNVPTTTNSVAGSGATVNITAISPFISVGIPQVVLQMYLNLAYASLQYNRWLDYWIPAMALFIAHYVTLYAVSESLPPGSTEQQIAASGLAKGLNVSLAAGDVSKSTEYILQGWEDWGSWNLTIYGQQLITMAAIVGIGGMYIY